MIAATLLAEKLTANSLFAGVPSFIAGLFLAYLFWGVRSSRLAQMHDRTSELRSEAERLRQQQAKLKNQRES